MAKAKGSPKTGGRQKGTPNKKEPILLERLRNFDQDPFDILFAFARGDWKYLGYESEVYHKEGAEGSVTMGYVITPELRAKTAKDVCEYLWPKRSSMVLSIEKLSDDELFAEAEKRILKEEEESENDKR